MCGVIGTISPRSEENVRLGLSRMMHRGIRSKVSSGAGWALGHVRLPIVGLGHEHDQPITRGDWEVAFVGEILDFREHQPGAASDVGLVADTWASSGPAGFTQFDGFWSVVACNRVDGSFYALTDYLGQKPLYLRHDRYATAIASEPDALYVLGPVQLDQVYLSAVVKWGYCPEWRRTPYTTIQRVGPGEHVTIRPGCSPLIKVVDPLQPVEVGDQSDLRREIEEAVKRRVESSDVPVACLVSGGLDSSIVWVLAKRYGDVKPYHVENNEWEYCSLVAPDAIRLDYRFVDDWKALIYMQEPLDLGSLCPQVALSDAIRDSGKERVCLTGDGADEFFGGYSRAERYDSQASDIYHELVAWHLPRLDRVMMKNRVEVRSPFLSRKVAGMALALPRGLRTGKKVLRELFKDDLPREIIESPKRPLRSSSVEVNREARSANLVDLFRRHYGRI